MTIGIDASRANLLHKTGTEWYSFYLIKYLALLDKNNKYILYVNKEPRQDLIDIVKDSPNFSFKLLYWPFQSFWTLGRLTWEMIWHRPRVLFVPAHALPLFGPLRTINTIHDVAFLREQNLYRSFKVRKGVFFSRPLINILVRLLTLGSYRSESVDYLHWSTAFALRHAKRIIAVSEFTKQEILDLYPRTKDKKVVVIHNGFNDKIFYPISNTDKIKEVLEKYDLSAPYFLYVGRLEKKKNTSTLVEAFALFKEAHPQEKIKLLLLGDASYGYDEVQYVIQEFGLDNEVIMPGWLEEEDLPYIFNAASAFIFPSKHEGFGIPVLQALACAVPSAVSDLPVLHEVVGDSVLYFNQNDKNDIAQALDRIINDKKLRQELKVKGLERVKEFSWRKSAVETLDLIESL